MIGYLVCGGGKMINDWVVVTKGCSRFGYEISAVRQSNVHGMSSYGWGDYNNKLIVLSTNRNFSAPVYIKQSIIDATVEYAQEICDFLNAGGDPLNFCAGDVAPLGVVPLAHNQFEIDKITIPFKMYLLTINGVCGWSGYDLAINTYAEANDINPRSFDDFDMNSALEAGGVSAWKYYNESLKYFDKWVNHIRYTKDYYDYEDFISELLKD